jgi:hypothetical protein
MRLLVLILCLSPLCIQAQDAFQWTNFTFGQPALSVSIPGKVDEQNMNLPPDAKAFVETYEAYYHRNVDNGLVVTMMHAFYKDDVQADKHGALEGTNNQWEATGSRVVIMSTTENKMSSKSAVQQMGVLMNAGREYDFMDVVIVEGAKIWQVIVMIPSDDKSLQPVLRKIVDSISL